MADNKKEHKESDFFAEVARWEIRFVRKSKKISLERKVIKGVSPPLKMKPLFSKAFFGLSSYEPNNRIVTYVESLNLLGA